jgi:crotonobetainyl-CoA:carnitine CoA-transferase CaiB-like acyl-CoA transferase
MSTSTLDELRLAYKQATDEWVAAIRTEEALATADHSELAWEHWDTAGFAEQDAQAKAKAARDAYKDSLRKANLGF